jgi:hypothetical protein
VPTPYELKIVNDSSSFATTTTHLGNSTKTQKTYQVNVTYEMAELQYSDVYPSLADWWSEWIAAYVDSPTPRLLIRFEDLLFHAEYVMAQIIECAHGSLDSGTDMSFAASQSSSSALSSGLLKPYDYKLTKAKTHGRSTDFIGAILKYARHDTKRSGGMTAQDLAFARGDDINDGNMNNAPSSNRSTAAPLQPRLMKLFSYNHPPANTPLRIQYRIMNEPS